MLSSFNIGNSILISIRQKNSVAVWISVTDFIDLPKGEYIPRCNFSPKSNLYIWCRWMHTTFFLNRECPAYQVLKISPADLEFVLLLHIILLVPSVVFWAVHLMFYVKEKEFHSWASFYFLNNIFTKTLTLSTNNITLTTRNNIILKLFVLVKLLVWWILADKSHVEQVTFKRLRLKSTQIID